MVRVYSRLYQILNEYIVIQYKDYYQIVIYNSNCLFKKIFFFNTECQNHCVSIVMDYLKDSI